MRTVPGIVADAPVVRGPAPKPRVARSWTSVRNWPDPRRLAGTAPGRRTWQWRTTEDFGDLQPGAEQAHHDLRSSRPDRHVQRSGRDLFFRLGIVVVPEQHLGPSLRNHEW
ncbi:hypothetical protein Sspor_77980 [Streptomyces spororaveus]|uniref:Uncharacterized protein n=1 Tax=Streptomyces spororaveus TaxID=284039 RepID=A0ABQ3TPI0_9ACTN|nr:hypothetical protein Sspor_77980 [Streptomyces spororaveus]